VNPRDVQASSPLAGAIDAGDIIMLNYFARADEPAEGGSPVLVFNFGKHYDKARLNFCDG
jgi:hypothetical protein